MRNAGGKLTIHALLQTSYQAWLHAVPHPSALRASTFPQGKAFLFFSQNDACAVGEVKFYAVIAVLRYGGIPLVVHPAKAAVAEIVG